MTITDIFGDLTNAYILNGGLFGMGVATSVSYLFSVLILVGFYISGKSSIKPNVTKIRPVLIGDVIKNGLPTAVSRISNTVKSALTIRIVLATIGGLGVAAISVQTSVDSFLGCVCPAIGMTVLMITSVIYGEEDESGLRDLFIQSIKMTVIITTLISIIIWFFSGFFVRLFLREPEAFDVASKCMQIYALSLPFVGFNACFQNFYQGSRKIGLTNMICILERMGFVTLCVFVLSKTNYKYGAFLGIPLGELLMTITVIVVAMVRNKKIRISINELLAINNSFDTSEAQIAEFTIRSLQGLEKTMADVSEFCDRCEIDNHKKNQCILLIEELAKNIITHGFSKNDNRIDIKLVSKEGGVKIRFRDDCLQFDPVSYWKMVDDTADVDKNIGLKLIMNNASDISYVYTIKMNNLVLTV